MTTATWSHAESKRYFRVVIGVENISADRSSVAASATSDPYGCESLCVHNTP